ARRVQVQRLAFQAIRASAQRSEAVHRHASTRRQDELWKVPLAFRFDRSDLRRCKMPFSDTPLRRPEKDRREIEEDRASSCRGAIQTFSVPAILRRSGPK